MTESTLRLSRGPLERIATAALSNGTLQPGGSISMTFSDGMVHVTLDQTGDWTITAGLTVASDRLLQLTKTFENLGFFQATEQAGVIYHLWTTALGEASDNRALAEETLLRVLKSFQLGESPSYIS